MRDSLHQELLLLNSDRRDLLSGGFIEGGLKWWNLCTCEPTHLLFTPEDDESRRHLDVQGLSDLFIRLVTVHLEKRNLKSGSIRHTNCYQ